MMVESFPEDVVLAGQPNLSLEATIALVERGHEPALRVLARQTHLDPLAYDLLLDCRHEVVLKTLAAREDLSRSQQFRLLRKAIPKVTRRLSRNSTLDPVLFQEMLQAYPAGIVSLLDHPSFSDPVSPLQLECLDEGTLADVLLHQRLSSEVVQAFWPHPSLMVLHSVLKTALLTTDQQEALLARNDERVTLALVGSGQLQGHLLKTLLDGPAGLASDKLAQALLSEYPLPKDQVRAFYGRGPQMRARVLASDHVDSILKQELQQQETAYLSVSERNDQFLANLHQRYPALKDLVTDQQETVDFAAVFEALHSGDFDPHTGDLLVSILLLEADLNRTSVSRDEYSQEEEFTFYQLFDQMKSEETLANVSEPMRFWLETNLDAVRRHAWVLWDVLRCEYLSELVFLAGFRLNRYIYGVCASDFCPVYLLELAVRVGGYDLSCIATQTLRRRFDGSVGNTLSHQRQRLKDEWYSATEAVSELDERRTQELYDQHMDETGY